MKSIKLIALLCLVISINACTNQSTNMGESNKLNNLTEDQLQFKHKLKEASLFVAEVVRGKNVRAELKFATNFNLENPVRDEDISFAELFGDDAPYKEAMKKQKVKNEFINSFRERFREVQKSKRKTKSGDEFDLESFLTSNNLRLYWPYSENFSEDDIPTISYHSIDNEDENEGFVVDQGKQKTNATFSTVTVNDEYAYNNSTYLIIPCEEEIQYYKTAQVQSSCGGGGGLPSDPTPPSDGGGGSGNVAKKVQIGYGKLTKQMDGLFAGGSEIYWHSANAILTYSGDTTPTVHGIKIKYTFSRPDISNKRWKTIFSDFDLNWDKYENARQMWIIEGDGDPKIKKLGIEVEIPKVGSVGFDIEPFEADDKTMDSRRTTLYNNWWERDIFMADNTSNGGNGLKGGFQIKHVDHLYWTMPVTNISY